MGSYLMDRDLAKEARTLFELLPPASNIFSGISRGTGVFRNAAYFSRIPHAYRFFRTGDWAPIDRAGRQYLLAAAARRERFTFHTTLSVDEYSHQHGPFSDRVLDAYRAFDKVLGEFRQSLAERGTLDRTLLCLSADHGHTEVTRHLDFEGFFEARGLRAFYFPYRPDRFFRCDAAVMVGGNAMAHVYLRGKHGWAERPDGDELLAEHPGLVDDLLARDEVQLVAWRSSQATGAIIVRTKAGEGQVRLIGDTVAYRPTRDADPFGYAPMPERQTRAELLARTAGTPYPDAPLQLAQLFESPRTGDLVVSAEPGCDLRVRFERWTHRSCHGSLHRDHIQVPFACSHPLAAGPFRTADVFPTILQGLGREAPRSDGRALLQN
jgi:arylsulfatase A-like enzyme